MNEYLLGFLVILICLTVVGFWWRHYSLICPASLSWLLDNPLMNALAGPKKLFERMQLAKGMKLLDVGSGTGRLTLPAARQVGESGEAVALDIQQKMLDKLQHRLDKTKINNVSLIHAGAGEGAIKKEYFDRVILVTVLGEISNQHEALLEIHAALKQDGVLSITELILDPHYTSKKKLRTLCEEVGFTEEKTYGQWWLYTMNFIKNE